MAKLINGKEISANIRAEIKAETEEFVKNTGVRPGLAVIIVGSDPASQVYVRNKRRACEEVGYYSEAYELVFIKVVGALSGEEYELSAENTFVMPEEDVTVSAEVKAKEYTVKFVVDGVVISEAKYKRGETVVVPEDPTKESDGTKVYTFIGWTPAVTMVSEDATYTAEFSEAAIGSERPPVNTDRTRYNTIIAIAVAGVLVVVVGIPVLTVVLVKRSKKKKAQRNNNPEEHGKGTASAQ